MLHVRLISYQQDHLSPLPSHGLGYSIDGLRGLRVAGKVRIGGDHLDYLGVLLCLPVDVLMGLHLPALAREQLAPPLGLPRIPGTHLPNQGTEVMILTPPHSTFLLMFLQNQIFVNFLKYQEWNRLI